MINLIDTHAHLTGDQLYPRFDEIVNNALSNGVNKILCICTNPEELQRALAHPNPHIDLAYGLNPQDLDKITPKYYQCLEDAVAASQLVAIGEIGLDYYWVSDNKEQQKALFIKQIELANQAGLPILIHMREATKDTLDILKAYCRVPFVMHCFSGSEETAQLIIKMGGYLSFAGPITFKNANGLLKVPPVVPSSRLFVETDCPYMAPTPMRGKENEPQYVRYTFETLTALKQADSETLAKTIQDNYQTLFYKKNK